MDHADMVVGQLRGLQLLGVYDMEFRRQLGATSNNNEVFCYLHITRYQMTHELGVVRDMSQPTRIIILLLLLFGANTTFLYEKSPVSMPVTHVLLLKSRMNAREKVLYLNFICKFGSRS